MPAIFVVFGGVHLAPGNLMVIFAAQVAWHAGVVCTLAVQRPHAILPMPTTAGLP
jgi:hypothetical protein